MKRIVVLGGGIGGTTVANRIQRLLSREVEQGQVEISVVDKEGIHAYQPGYLMVVFDKMRPEETRQEESRLLHRSIRLVKEEVSKIDAAGKKLLLAGGRSLPYDILVIATGSVLHPELCPGFAEGAHSFYDLDNAVKLRDQLRQFSGGRIVVTVAGMPYKCPVAPLEVTFMLDDYLRSRGLRDKSEIHYTYPIPRVFGIETVAPVMQRLMTERGIQTHTPFNVQKVEAASRRLVGVEGESLDYDLLIGIPPHRGADVIAVSGLGDKGNWVPTDKFTLRAENQNDIYVLGDATNIAISKAGSTADYEAETVAQSVAAQARGLPPSARYEGRVYCWIMTGLAQATYIKFDYQHPPHPPTPSFAHYWNKMIYNRVYWDMTARAMF
jgi:sulfide:quinone oxidoreductase